MASRYHGETFLEKVAILSEQSPPNTLFAVLGFLEEYAGRRVTYNGDRVETFGADEAPQAKQFERCLRRLIDENQLQTTLRCEVVGNCTHFYSRELTGLIDSHYLAHGLTGSNPDGSPAYTKGAGVVRSHAGRMALAAFPPGDREARLAYLVGAHQRWGQQNSFKVAYGFHKVKLLKQLLHEVGSPNVVIIYPGPELVPSVYQVAFEPTPELIARLNIELLAE